ncbi:hypothetical protein DXX93_12180 [Thalassotalea euphylliae]|uniref:Uncharacterized protein n=1 Tax=Thalassotalea euphylliae TaxID=1655234 RepID=A0A3E0TRV7_9GAMM|nr:hypothetical protein [Thalassotalea euphylliae]REL27248.1 hypothetical protein DXX93_12180 [Thalassotalea euphylliae]
MNKNTIPHFIGVIASVIVIAFLVNLTIVDDCLDNGGAFSYETGQCVLANQEIYVASYHTYLVALYFFIGVTVAFCISKLVRKIIGKRDGI